MKRFNLSDWALNHRSFVWFLLLISLIVTWLGTDYVLNHVVIPLIEDRQPGPDLPAS